MPGSAKSDQGTSAGSGDDLGDFMIIKRPRLNSPVTISNRFDAIAPNDPIVLESENNASEPMDDTDNVMNSDEHKPPPFFINTEDYEIDIEKMNTIFTRLVGHKSYSTKSLSKKIKVQANTVSSYKTLKKFCDDKDIPSHTHQLKSDRPFKVMLKNLHHSFPIASLTDALNAMGHTVRRINKVWNKKFQYFYNMFKVELEVADNNKDAYNINYIDNMEVVVEPPYKSQLPPQCTNCQQTFHTKNYCKNKPKCVICGQQHKTQDCTLDKSAPPKCANCGGPHTANYGGCEYLSKYAKKQSAPLSQPAPQHFNMDQQSFPGLRGPNQTNRDYRESNERAWSTPAPAPASNRFEDCMLRMERLMEKQMELTNNMLNMLTQLVSKLQCK